jgi:hypothetical protein
MNNHQKSTFYPLSIFSSDAQQSSRRASLALVLLGQGLRKSLIWLASHSNPLGGQKLNFAHHLYLCTGLIGEIRSLLKNRIKNKVDSVANELDDIRQALCELLYEGFYE